ncbi:hypothetical protein JCM11491_004580 [Sporobolomyces phaffii]
MTGLVRHRTPTQFARITRVYELSSRAKLDAGWARFSRRLEQEEQAAREWNARPWKFYEVVGPLELGRFAQHDGLSKSIWNDKERQRARERDEKARRDRARTGALPRVSAPAFHRKRPKSTYSHPSAVSSPFTQQARSFSAVPLPTSIKVAPAPRSSVLAQTYSTRTLARKNFLRTKFPPDTKVDLVQIMNDFRDLELLELIQGARPKSATGFKDAHRALYPLYHRFDQNEIPHVTFGDLDAALPELYSSAWTTIEQRLVGKKVAKLDSLYKNDKAILSLVALHSIGPRRAEAFVAQGCKSAEDLLKADKLGKIKLSKAQKVGLVHREDFDRLIPREEMEKLKSALMAALREVDPKFECEILGSYRRGVGFSSDVDLAVRHPTFIDKDDEETGRPLMDSIVRRLEDEGLVNPENQLMLGAKKYAGLMKLPGHRHYRRIDIRLAPHPSYPYMLLGTTGDSILMKLMRHTAKKKGWCLNEFGMGQKYDAADENPNGFRPGTMKIVESEKEIFELLGLPYLEPQQRELAIWKPIFRKAGIPGLDTLHRL